MGGAPVAAGGGDNAAGAAGVGVIGDGDALLSLGTSGVTFVAGTEFRANPEEAVHAFCHCLPERWHQMAVHLSAAACLDWAARQLGMAGVGDVLAAAERSGVAQGPELFLPYLSGERTPFNDPHIRAAWLGMGNDTDRDRLAASVLEGVAFAVADGLDALRRSGAAIEELVVIGGGARSAHWGAILAATLQVRLIYIAGGEVGPALGAAKLAQIAVTGASPAEVCARPPVTRVIAPDRLMSERLAPKLAAFRSAAAAVRSI
jgi:xylulokinase